MIPSHHQEYIYVIYGTGSESHDDYLFYNFMTDITIAHGMNSSLIHYFDNTSFAQARKMIKENIEKWVILIFLEFISNFEI